MNRPVALLLAALPWLAGCPIPQPLAEVSKTAGTVTPPRILVEAASAAGVVGTADGVVPYDTACPGGPQFTIGATVIDDNTEEVATARWFVDYDPAGGSAASPVLTEDLSPPSVQPLNRRPVAPYVFKPVPFGAGPHLVELVVSNGFGPISASPPYRAPAPNYEVQVFRWIFVEKTGGRCD